MHNDEIMKATTLCGYSYKEKYIECSFPVKIKDFNIMQFEQWKRDINKARISLRYKNDIYKFLRSILNFGVKWHGFNFNNVYNKMTKFQDPTKILTKKEEKCLTITMKNLKSLFLMKIILDGNVYLKFFIIVVYVKVN